MHDFRLLSQDVLIIVSGSKRSQGVHYGLWAHMIQQYFKNSEWINHCLANGDFTMDTKARITIFQQYYSTPSVYIYI